MVAVSYCRGVGCRGERNDLLNRNTYMTVTSTLFLVVAIVHLLRIILGWPVEVGGVSIPFWLSWLALLASGALAYFGLCPEAVARRGTRGHLTITDISKGAVMAFQLILTRP
jgi:hypothetical protein